MEEKHSVLARCLLESRDKLFLPTGTITAFVLMIILTLTLIHEASIPIPRDSVAGKPRYETPIPDSNEAR